MSREMTEKEILSIPKRRLGRVPEDGFFEEFTHSTLREIERRGERRSFVRRCVISTLSAAAAVSVVVLGYWNESDVSDMAAIDGGSQELCYIESQFDKRLDLYVDKLTVDDIETLLDATESDDIFYSNL